MADPPLVAPPLAAPGPLVAVVARELGPVLVVDDGTPLLADADGAGAGSVLVADRGR